MTYLITVGVNHHAGSSDKHCELRDRAHVNTLQAMLHYKTPSFLPPST